MCEVGKQMLLSVCHTTIQSHSGFSTNIIYISTIQGLAISYLCGETNKLQIKQRKLPYIPYLITLPFYTDKSVRFVCKLH